MDSIIFYIILMCVIYFILKIARLYFPQEPYQLTEKITKNETESKLSSPPPTIEKIIEAEQYHIKAQFILNQLHANLKVYGSNTGFNGESPANVDLALQYIDRSLEISPENAIYMNLKALLLWEGKGDKKKQ